MMRRCRSLLALPSIFSNQPNSPASTSLNPNFEPDQQENLSREFFGDSRQIYRCSSSSLNPQISQISSQENHQTPKSSKQRIRRQASSQDQPNSAKKFFKSLLVGSRDQNSPADRRRRAELVAAAADSPPVPEFVHWLLADLFRRGPSTVGVFRKSPNARHCRELKQQLESAKTLAELDLDSYQVIVVASVLKEWLRSMPDCLLSSSLFHYWIEVAKLISSSNRTNSTNNEHTIECLRIVCQLLARLGENKLHLLKSLICVLCRIADQSELNKMSSTNLGVCIGQSLLVEEEESSRGRRKAHASSPTSASAISCVPQLIAFLIDNASLLFGDELEVSARRYAQLASRLSPPPALSSSSTSAQSSPSPTSPVQRHQGSYISTSSTPSPLGQRNNMSIHYTDMNTTNISITSISNTSSTSCSSHDHPKQHHTARSSTCRPMDPSATPSPSDSGHCTTTGSESSSSASSSASSDSSSYLNNHLTRPRLPTSAPRPQAASVSCASDLARRQLAGDNWCLCYYTPWEEPSRSHVMSLRDYYLSLQLEHQRQQEQMRKVK